MAAPPQENAQPSLKRKAEDEEETTLEAGSAGSEPAKTYKPILMERNADGTPMKKRIKKSVSFDGVKVYFFPRSQGFTSVPSQGGATLGMSPKHDAYRQYSLVEFADLQDLSHRNAIKLQLLQRRREQLHQNNLEFNEESLVEDVEEEVSQIVVGDYYFLQPVPTKQRRALLRTAGIRKIDRTEKAELKRIRVSRESCGCDCAGYCDPRTCQCSLAGIKCQVDRMSFPCGCTRDYCRNANGRIEFDPTKVREHFVATMQKLEWEENGEGSSSPESGGSPSPEREGQTTGPKSSLLDATFDSSHSGFSSSSFVFSNPLKTFHNEGFHPFEPYQSFPSSASPLQPHPSGFSGLSSESPSPLRVESCQSLGYGQQKLHFNELDIDAHGDRNFGGVGLTPVLPNYDSSEDSLSSSSDASSMSAADGLCQEADPYYFGNAADFGRPIGSDTSHYHHSSEDDGSDSSTNSKDSPDQSSGKTYTELTQSSTLQSFGFPQFPNVSQSSTEGQGLPPMGSIFQSLARSRHDCAAATAGSVVTLGMLSDMRGTLAGGHGGQLYSTYSTAATVNSIEEMKETALATSSISTPPSALLPSTLVSEETNMEAKRAMDNELGEESLEVKGGMDSPGESGDGAPFTADVLEHQQCHQQFLKDGLDAPPGSCRDQEGNDGHDRDVGDGTDDSPREIPADRMRSDSSVIGPGEVTRGHESGQSDRNAEEDPEEVFKLLEEEERDSSDSSSDSAVFSGAEDPCLAGEELDEGTGHTLTSDSSNDSGVVTVGKRSQEGTVLGYVREDLVEGLTEIPTIPSMFTPLDASSLPILTAATAE